MAKTIHYLPECLRVPFALTVKNLHQFSPYEARERRYPFLVAIDLMVHFALSFSAIILSVIALAMAVDSVFPGVVSIPPFWLYF